jgi:hypothetical protein
MVECLPNKHETLSSNSSTKKKKKKKKEVYEILFTFYPSSNSCISAQDQSPPEYSPFTSHPGSPVPDLPPMVGLRTNYYNTFIWCHILDSRKDGILC